MSKYNTFMELMNIRTREGEIIIGFANWYQGLLHANIDPDHEIIKYLFFNMLLSEVQTPQAVELYEEEKNSGLGFPCRKQISRKLCWKVSDTNSN